MSLYCDYLGFVKTFQFSFLFHRAFLTFDRIDIPKYINQYFTLLIFIYNIEVLVEFLSFNIPFICAENSSGSDLS